MKAIIQISCWGLATTAALYACISPERGVLYTHPMVTIGVGMIGLGLCIEARSRLIAQKVEA